MVMIVGFILFLIGLASFIFLLVFGYKEFKSDESKTSKKVLYIVIGIFEIISGTGGDFVGFALLLALAAILMGLGIIGMLHYIQ